MKNWSNVNKELGEVLGLQIAPLAISFSSSMVYFFLKFIDAKFYLLRILRTELGGEGLFFLGFRNHALALVKHG